MPHVPETPKVDMSAPAPDPKNAELVQVSPQGGAFAHPDVAAKLGPMRWAQPKLALVQLHVDSPRKRQQILDGLVVPNGRGGRVFDREETSFL